MFTHTTSLDSRGLRNGFLTGCLALLVATAACSDDSNDIAGTGAPVEVPGSYALSQVTSKGNLGGGGSGLPVTFTDGGGNKLTFKSGWLDLDANGDYDLEVQANYRGNDLEMTDWGTYNQSGAAVTFTSTSGNPRLFTATMQGATLTVQSQFGSIPFEIELRKE